MALPFLATVPAGTGLVPSARMLPATTEAPRVLIADDQADVLDALRLLLHPEGILTEAVQSPSGRPRRAWAA